MYVDIFSQDLIPIICFYFISINDDIEMPWLLSDA